MIAKLANHEFVGLFFKNSNGKKIHLRKFRGDRTVVEYMSTGGVLDFYFFHGYTADDVIASYHKIIGQPMLPPFWSLGYF